MPVYTETKTYKTKAHMGMIDVTDDFRAAVQNACRKTGMKSGTSRRPCMVVRHLW